MHHKALKINSALEHKGGMASNYGNLGNLYKSKGMLDKAEAMYRKSLEIVEALGLKEMMAGGYCNLGNLYQNQSKLGDAEEMYLKSIALYRELGSPNEQLVEGWLEELRQSRK